MINGEKWLTERGKEWNKERKKNKRRGGRRNCKGRNEREREK